MWHGGAGQAWREEVTTYYSIDVTARLMALLDARAARDRRRDSASSRSICTPVLEPNLATYYDFFHLTPSGARSVAAVVARTLLRERRAPAAPDGEAATCADLRAS